MGAARRGLAMLMREKPLIVIGERAEHQPLSNGSAAPAMSSKVRSTSRSRAFAMTSKSQEE